MNTSVARVILILLPLYLLLVGCSNDDTPAILVQHEKTYPDIRKKYVYQSVIRLANIKHDQDFEKLIKDVRRIILYLPPSGDSTYQIKDLRSGMSGDGYEKLVDVRTADAQRISLWIKDSESKQHYIALVDSDKNDMILEMDGQINLKYLNAINMADQGSLMELLQGGF